MKRVLIITNLFPDKFSPCSEVFVQKQVEELSKSYAVRVIATRFKYSLSVEQEDHKTYQVTYIYIPVIKYVHLSLMYFYRRYALPVIDKLIGEWQPDIIHVHDYRHVPELLLLHKCLGKYPIPRYLTAHNIRTHPVMARTFAFKWFYRLCLKQSYSGWKHIFTVNERIGRIISQDVKITGFTNIGNAVGPVPEIESSSLDSFRKMLSNKSFNLISVGNLKYEKGFHILIDAISRLISKNYNLQLFIVGKGAERDKLLSDIKSKKLEKNVVLTGDLNNEIVRNLYSLFDAFVLSSYSETFGVVYIEAMYAGLPVVGIKGQGIDGVVRDGENGFLAKPRDVEDLAAKIEYIINNRESVRAVATRGQSLIQDEYRIEQLIKKITDVYEQ
ncbi:MAG: glycosyltransferase [Candidatus Cloacimonadaceae bacterium]